MAATSGPGDTALKQSLAPSDLEARLREQPCTFGFFQAVRLLERLLPERKPVGRFVNPSEEIARFGSNPSLAFPASQIQSLEWNANKPHQMKVNFLGLMGPVGALPHWYTGLIAERLRAKAMASPVITVSAGCVAAAGDWPAWPLGPALT